MMNDTGAMWFGGGFMWLFWIILLVVIVWAIKQGTQGDSNSDNRTSSNESALDILEKRYASGEINEQEFVRKRKQLEK